MVGRKYENAGIKVGDAQARRRLTRSRGNKANQKPERIAISRVGMAACLHLRANPVGEEALAPSRELHAGHEQISRSLASVIRADATSSSSGTASTYPEVCSGLGGPTNVVCFLLFSAGSCPD